MSNNAKAVKSIRKTDLVSQKTPFVAFKAFSFADEATAGQTVISLSALTVPTSYASRGFVQPSASDLSSANLLLYRRNLRLQSTLRGVLMEYDAYDVTGSMTIRLNFPAEAGEIFIGVISDVSKTGLQVIDGQSLVSTGVLGANASDYVVGQSFALNKYSAKQVGDVLVFLDGQLMYRNVGNATASPSADGNYQEIDAGSGLSNTIRFNIVDPIDPRPVIVLSNGMLAERPEGSLRAEIETLAGQNDSIIETLAVVAGVPTTNFRSAPNSVDLQTFGQRLITMETNRARIDLSNTWTANQQFLGLTTGATIGAGYVGEVPTPLVSSTQILLASTMDAFVDFAGTLTLQPGIWLITAQMYLQLTTTVGGSPAIDGLIGEVAIRTGSTTVALTAVARASGNTTYAFGSAPVQAIVNISTATIYKISTYLRTVSAAVTASGVYSRGDFHPTSLRAVRIA
jgi:hypothetical protein